MSKTKKAIELLKTGVAKNINQAAQLVGLKDPANVYRAAKLLDEDNPRRCPCCEQILDARLEAPLQRFHLVNQFLDQFDATN